MHSSQQSSPQLPTTVWIQILNWKKFNDAKPSVKATSWFRMENEWLEHPDFVGIGADQCLLWSYLLGKASPKLKQRGVIYISIEHARYTSKMQTAERVCETLQYFQSKKLIRQLNDPSEAVFDEDRPKEEPKDPPKDPSPAPQSEHVPNACGRDSESVPTAVGTPPEDIPDTFRPTERDETERDETERQEGATRASARAPALIAIPPPIACELCRDTGCVVATHAALGDRAFACACALGASEPPEDSIGRWGDPRAVEGGWEILKPPERPDDDLRAAAWFQAGILRRNPKARRARSVDLAEWAEEFRRMRDELDLTHADIGPVLEFVLGHRYWLANAGTPAKLRVKWDEVTAEMSGPPERGRTGRF